jgi:hypothetical protein
MGWSHGRDENRPKGDQEIGYGVEATCDHNGCNVGIDRGLAFVCGGDPYGGDFGCGGFFCHTAPHLDYYFTSDANEDMSRQLCPECGKKWEQTITTQP